MAVDRDAEFARVFERLKSIIEPSRRGYERSAGAPGWGVRRREAHDMTHRRAMRSAKRRGAGTSTVD